MLKYLSIILFAVIFSSCNNPEEKFFEEKNKKDSAVKKTTAPEKMLVKKFEEFSENPGGVGVYDMPEMLTLCIHDSASLQNMPKACAKAYRTLDEELKNLKLKVNGAPGSIYFTNNPDKIVFECVYPIEKMPVTQPKKSMVVVLEACYMYMYNYYGPYGDLSIAYNDIRNILKESKLEQNGPMREFYITDPSLEKDSTKWLTRIMTPVGKLNSKH